MWGTVIKSLLGIGCFKLCCNDKLNKSYVILVFGQVSNVDNVEQQPLQKKWKWEETENDKLHQVKDVKNSQPAILKRQVKIKTWNVFYENLILTYQGFKTNLEK